MNRWLFVWKRTTRELWFRAGLYAVFGVVAALAAALPAGGELLLQSDVEAVIVPMVQVTEASGCFERPADDPRPYRSTNPLPVATEREQHVLSLGLPVYRVLYRRNGADAPASEGLEEAACRTHNPPTPGA